MPRDLVMINVQYWSLTDLDEIFVVRSVVLNFQSAPLAAHTCRGRKATLWLLKMRRIMISVGIKIEIEDTDQVWIFLKSLKSLIVFCKLTKPSNFSSRPMLEVRGQ